MLGEINPKKLHDYISEIQIAQATRECVHLLLHTGMTSEFMHDLARPGNRLCIGHQVR